MAYGQNAPFGLRPVASLTSSSWVQKINAYNIFTNAAGTTTYATSLFSGDPVIWNPTAATTIAGVPTIARYTVDTATVANEITPVLGVFLSCFYIDVNGMPQNSMMWPASTNVLAGSKIIAYVCDDPDIICEIQVSTATNVANDARFGGTTNTAAVAAYFGQNFGFGLAAGGANLVPQNPATGSTITKQSAYYLNMVGTVATNRLLATLPLKAIDFSPNVQQVVSASDGTTVNQFLTVLVMLNNHVYRVGQLGTTPA